MFKTGTIQLPADDPTTGMTGTWSLDAGTGTRSYVSPDIQFVPPWIGAVSTFSSPPTVVLSLAGVEAPAGLTAVSLGVENVQAEEFNIRVVAFDNSTLKRVSVTWFAYDAV